MSRLCTAVSLLDMISILTGGTFSSVGNLSQAADMFYRTVEAEEGDFLFLRTDLRDTLEKSINEILRVATESDLDATAEIATTCWDLLARARIVDADASVIKKSDGERLSWMLNTLNRTLAAQMQSRVVIVFDSRNSKYILDDSSPFGAGVDDAFPKAAEEISEAAKCLALQRHTACVFHLMRAMELAVARLAEAIGTGKPTDKEWGKILSDIGQAIEALPKGSERDRWSESHSHLYHVKQAWRNDTMHPKKTYSEEQSQAVFDAVRSFFMHLAPLVG